METFKQHGSHIVKVTLFFLAATVLLLWGWNSTIPDLFALPVMQFKQALGVMIVLGVFSILGRPGRRACGAARTARQDPD
jgi:hypothetical protein